MIRPAQVEQQSMLDDDLRGCPQNMLPHFFIGWQELPASMGGGKMALFNLTQPLGKHPIGSTITERTLEQHGYSRDQIAALILAGTAESDAAAVDTLT